jgi:hypothetical protein
MEFKMLKISARILIILFVTALLAGGMYALVQFSGATAAAAGPDPRLDGEQRLPPPEGFRERDGERGGEGDFSLGRGLAGVLGTLLKIGVVTLLVLGAQKLLNKTPA